MEKHNDNLTEAFDALTLLLENPQFDEDEEEWMAMVGLGATIVQLVHEDIMAMDAPPPKLAEFHEMMLSATQDFSDAMDYLMSAVVYQDTDARDKYVELMTSGGEKMERATELMLEFGQ